MQIERDLDKLAQRFQADVDEFAFKAFERIRRKESETSVNELKEQFGLKRKPSSSLFKESKEDGRIYPGYFAPVMTLEDGKRVIRPMRYRVRPEYSSEEIPSKFNVFNARLDSLDKRKTWNSVFLKQHALFPFRRFFEWVEKDGKKQLIAFNPEGKDLMWAPALYHHWQSPNGQWQMDSFALITAEPPSEVLAQGHDRCPIFLKEAHINKWLEARALKPDQAYDLLGQKEEVVYDHKFIGKP